MNCDPIARAYCYLEYGSFGSALQRRRCHFLPQLGESRKVLMLGEGDGRFLAEFVRRNPNAEVDYVDASAKMLALAQRRAGSTRVHFHHRNLLDATPPQGPYDTITTHFFLDCLSDNDITGVVQRIATTASPGARWVVSEFREPETGWRKLRAKLWVSGLYAAFGIVTHLSTRKLPDHGHALRQAGFVLQAEALASAGLLTSQLWIGS
jgi:ubiquinone/menaquinone biosynthesis C-methylase UbiE